MEGGVAVGITGEGSGVAAAPAEDKGNGEDVLGEGELEQSVAKTSRLQSLLRTIRGGGLMADG